MPLDIPLRKSLLLWLDDYLGRAPEAIWKQYKFTFGCADASDVHHRLDQRYGDGVGGRWWASFVDAVRGGVGGTRESVEKAIVDPEPPVRAYAVRVARAAPAFALLHLPEPEFLMALEHTLHGLEADGPFPDEDPANHVNRVLGEVGVPYRYAVPPASGGDSDVVGEREFLRLLDSFTEEQVVVPALWVLEDPRLRSAAENFASGRRRVAKVDTTELDDAVRDFARAVQEVLFVLAAESCDEISGGTAGALYGQLKNRVLPPESESLVLAVSKLRNTREHPRGEVREVDAATAHAALQSAAAAIGYLAAFLPRRRRLQLLWRRTLTTTSLSRRGSISRIAWIPRRRVLRSKMHVAVPPPSSLPPPSGGIARGGRVAANQHEKKPEDEKETT